MMRCAMTLGVLALQAAVSAQTPPATPTPAPAPHQRDRLKVADYKTSGIFPPRHLEYLKAAN